MPFEDSHPVLPPRPDATGRMQSQDTGPAWWKSWPVLVIILASLAIVAAIILLVIPSGDGAKGKRLIEPPGPAPDRMNTNPLTPKSDPGAQGPSPAPDKDPWGQQGKIDPGKRPAPPDPIPDPSDDPDLADPFSGGGGGGLGGGLGGLGMNTGMMAAMAKHGCDRLTSCGTDPSVKMVCDRLSQVLGRQPGRVPSCAAATRCLAQIDELDCDIKVDDFGAIIALQSKFVDCAEAMSC